MVVELQDYGWGDMYYGMLAHASGGEYIWVDAGGLPKESKENKGVGIILTNEMVGNIVNETLVRYYALRTRAPGGASVQTRATRTSSMKSKTSSKPPRQQSLTTVLTTSADTGIGNGTGIDSSTGAGAGSDGATFHGIEYRFVTTTLTGEETGPLHRPAGRYINNNPPPPPAPRSIVTLSPHSTKYKYNLPLSSITLLPCNYY